MGLACCSGPWGRRGDSCLNSLQAMAAGVQHSTVCVSKLSGAVWSTSTGHCFAQKESLAQSTSSRPDVPILLLDLSHIVFCRAWRSWTSFASLQGRIVLLCGSRVGGFRSGDVPERLSWGQRYVATARSESF